MESKDSKHNAEAPRASNACSLILRLLVVAATLTAAIVMWLGKETKTVYITVAPTLPPLPVTAIAKFTNSSAFVYFIVTNAIVCFYSLASLILSFANKGKKTNLALMITVADILILALLFSGNAAASAIGVAGEKGVPKVGWNKVCNQFTKFCAHVLVAITINLVACLAYLVLVVLALVGLHNKSPK